MLFSTGSQSIVPAPRMSALPGHRLEVKILRPYLRPTESETVVMRLRSFNCALTSPPGDLNT